MELSPLAVRVFGELLESRTGQQLADNRLWRVDTALQPLLREHGVESLEALATAASSGSNARLGDAIAEALLNHESFFFRDPPAFTQLTELIASRFHSARQHERRLRIWSSGCSTGQEVYSLAISFAEQSHVWDGWTIDILGTDVSRTAVDRAKTGIYSQFEIQRGLPVRQMLRWFESKDEDWHASTDLRQRVRFQLQSLLDPAPMGAPFDVILCRNVLLYFSGKVRTGVFEHLHKGIASDGILMLGAGETVLGQTSLFESDPESRGLYRPVVKERQSKAA
jgi:Methylase of chemotaxis methyl-accepting proteins